MSYAVLFFFMSYAEEEEEGSLGRAGVFALKCVWGVLRGGNWKEKQCEQIKVVWSKSAQKALIKMYFFPWIKHVIYSNYSLCVRL